jgi:hypothetical protein
MEHYISAYDQLPLLFRLLAAHFVADFLLQPARYVKQRFKMGWASSWLYVHGCIAGILFYLFSAAWGLVWFPVALAASHIFIDGIKAKTSDTARTFILDQLAHLFIIVFLWFAMVSWNYVGLLAGFVEILHNSRYWAVALAYIIIIWPVGILIGHITRSWRATEKSSKSDTGLDRAGLWIGRLERFLILTLVLLNRYEAIGFLIAAKSIFRFAELKREAEYIIIGTMMSFAAATTLGILVSWALKSLPLP